MFAIVFVVLPSIPVVIDIRADIHRGDRRTAWLLVLIALVYDLALMAQTASPYSDRFGTG